MGLSAAVHTTFTTEAALQSASVAAAGVATTSGVGAVAFSAETPDATLSAVVHVTFTTGLAGVDATVAPVGVSAVSTAEGLGASSTEMSETLGAEGIAGAGGIVFLGGNSVTPAGAGATFAAGTVEPTHSTNVVPAGVVSQTGTNIPNWIGGPQVDITPEGAQGTAETGIAGVELTQNPRVFGVSAFSEAGEIFVSIISLPRPSGVSALAGAGFPTVRIGDISELAPPRPSRNVEWEFNECHAEWKFSRGAVIEFGGRND